MNEVLMFMNNEMKKWNKADYLSSRRNNLLEKIASVADEIKAIDDQLKLIRSNGFKENLR